MAKPIVAIVGRPNVGKSAFFNYIVGKRISIVEDTPGVTRDRIYASCSWRSKDFTVIDTGGIEPYSDDQILKQMKLQAEVAIDTADVIVLMVDVKCGVVAADKEVASYLHKSGKKIIVACNKVDQVGEPPMAFYEFYGLGIGDVFPVSSIHGLGMGELLDCIYDNLPEPDSNLEEDESIKVAIIGKPNAGKSSLINRILGEDRVIVSNIPGTTRDAIDTNVERNGKKYTFIDTAGVRRKGKINEKIEKYSVLRVWTAVDRADVCILLIDAQDGVTEQDTKIAGYAHEEGKGVIIAINKWDLIQKENSSYKKYIDEARKKLIFMLYAKSTAISAKTGKRVELLFDDIDVVYESCIKRVSTGVLNDVLNDAVAMVQPPSDRGKRLKIYYATQATTQPPTFVLFINNKKLFHFSYERYLKNQFREAFGFEGTSIKIIIKEKNKGDKK